MSRHTVTCAGGGDSNWPIVPDCALRRCTTGFMLSHKLSVSQYSHLALAQRHCGAVRGRARPRRLGAGTVRCEQTFFFLCGRRPVGGCGRSGPRPPRSSRACRAVLPGRRHRTHPPATSSPLLALAPRCTSAVSLCNPATAVSTSGQWCLQHQERRKSAARHAQR